MSTVSFIRSPCEVLVLDEVKTGSRFLELPPPEYTDREYEEVFRDAQARLGLEDLEPVHEGGKTKLVAPDGYKFRITGAFTLWPDGNDISWGYGPPTDSYEEWRRQNQGSLARYEAEGLSPEEAEKRVADGEWETSTYGIPSIEYYEGPSLTFSFDDVEWGGIVPTDRESRHSSDDGPPTVKVRLSHYRETWLEQARRHIKLPNSENDRLLATHQYGQPGIIPCWKGGHSDGDIENIAIELVPIGEDDGDKELPMLKRLWVPENVRWTLYEDFPDLIDQDGDEASRTDMGGAMRMFGEVMGLLGGSDQNMFDQLSAESRLAVVDHPMLAHMDTGKLAEAVEELIQITNEQEPGKDREREREEENAKKMEAKRKRLVVITDLDESIHSVARRIGADDTWLEDHARYVNSFDW